MKKMVAFLIRVLTILYFSRWRPIWPPNQTKSHISAEKHDRQTLCSAVKKVTLTVTLGSIGPQIQERYNFGFFQGIKPKFLGFGLKFSCLINAM